MDETKKKPRKPRHETAIEGAESKTRAKLDAAIREYAPLFRARVAIDPGYCSASITDLIAARTKLVLGDMAAESEDGS